jgi:hypothetical protein
MSETPFDSIEGAQQYVSLLAEAVDDAAAAVREDARTASGTNGAERQLEALRIVEYKLNQLRTHLTASRRLLNDLRSLRRLLLGEREDSTP